MVKKILILTTFLYGLMQTGTAQHSITFESGGVLSSDLAAFNVHFYELDLKINPGDSTVAGHVDVHFDIVHPTN